MNLELKNKTVLVTGASKGIGAGIAESFAAEGCDLILVARSKEALALLKNDLESKYAVKCSFYVADMSSSEAILNLVSQLDKIDVLVNNAGAIPAGDLMDIDIQTWKKSWDLKLWGYIEMTQLLYRRMKQNTGGVIVNVIGVAGEKLNNQYIAGTAANASLIAFTKSVGSVSLNDGIRVLGVNPGATATERIKKLGAYEHLSNPNNEDKAERLATVREIADVVVFLSSGRASFVSGIVVNIDGGFASRN